MNITIWGLIVCVLLLILPVGLMLRLRSAMALKVGKSLGQMAFILLLVGLNAHWLLQVDRWWISLPMLVAVVALMTFFASRHCHQPKRRLLIPSFVATLLSVLAVGLLVMLFIVPGQEVTNAQLLVPFLGVMIGTVASSSVRGLDAYFTSLVDEGSTYYYLIGNGGSRFEALLPFVRKGLESIAVPLATQLATLGLAQLPLFMMGQVIVGNQPLDAASLTFAAISATWFASVVAFLLTVGLTFKKTFDKSGKMIEQRASDNLNVEA